MVRTPFVEHTTTFTFPSTGDPNSLIEKSPCRTPSDGSLSRLKRTADRLMQTAFWR